MTLRLGINLGYQDWANGLPQAVSLVQRAEALGFHSAWTAEAYGTDAVTPLTWLMAHTERMEFGPAIMQIEEAKAVCRRCDVVDTCLKWALESGQDAGVWGGLSEDERRALKRRNARARRAG